MAGQLEEARRRLEATASASEGKRLPPIRELALLWDMSARTVQLAVAEAVRAGRLETRQGAGTWLRGARPAAVLPAPKPDAGRLAERIEAEIRAGRFGSGQPLPPPKDLAQLHGVHVATVRKALGHLLGQGLVERLGRAWRVTVPHPRRALRSPVLLCIGAGDAQGGLRMDTDREWDFWREIQAEAVRCGLVPRLVAWGQALPLLEGAFGAVVSTWHLQDSTQLLDGLMRARLPTAVWVANHETLPGTRYRQARTLWFHDLAFGKEAGQTMAKALAGLGHRKLAWISPFHGSSWSRNRLEGLRGGLPADFELVEAVEGWVSEWDVQKDVHLDPQVLGRIDLEGIDHGGSLATIARPLVEAVTRDRCLAVFGPRLEAVLDSGATLWVAASDLAAGWCWHWLQSRGLRMPPMVSFDDSREASRTGLTSMRFDVQGMARAMLRQVVSSRQPHRRLTRYAGDVVVRASSGARRAGESR